MSEGLKITMIRCSTLVLEGAGLRFLTDPWFSMHLRGLPCFRKPGLGPGDLEPVDAVLVSHLHPDHFDRKAMGALKPPPGTVIFPPNALRSLRCAEPGWRELDLWKSIRLGPVTVTAVPGPHTYPGPDEANFVLEMPDSDPVFFGGDARFEEGVIRRIAERFAPFRLALLPVGGTRIFGKRTVMAPCEAEAAADILQARTIIPIHEGGIWMSVPPLSLHPGRARHLVQRFEERGEAHRIVNLEEGQSVRL